MTDQDNPRTGYVYQRADGLFAIIHQSHTHTGSHFDLTWTDELALASHYPMRNWLLLVLRPQVDARLKRYGCEPGEYRPIIITKTLVEESEPVTT